MLIYRINPSIWFEVDKGDGGGGESTLPDAVIKSFEKLMERKGGDASAVALMLFDENKRYRDEIATLRGKVPVEGATILTGDDAKAWDAYKGLGKPDEVKQGLEQRAQLDAQVKEAQRSETLRTIASKAQYNPTVLAKLDQMAGGKLAYEVKTETVEGAPVERVYVKDGTDSGAQAQPLSEYAKQTWAEFLPSLQVQPQGVSTYSANAGTRFPEQHAGSIGKPTTTKDVAQATVNKLYQSRK